MALEKDGDALDAGFDEEERKKERSEALVQYNKNVTTLGSLNVLMGRLQPQLHDTEKKMLLHQKKAKALRKDLGEYAAKKRKLESENLKLVAKIPGSYFVEFLKK